MKAPPRCGDGLSRPQMGVRLRPLSAPTIQGAFSAGPRCLGVRGKTAHSRRSDSLETLGHVLALLALRPGAAGGRQRLGLHGLPHLCHGRHEPQSEGVAIQAAARAAPGCGRAGFHRQPAPVAADPPRRCRASHYDGRAGRCGHREWHQGTRVRYGRKGLGRAVAARVRASGAQFRSSRQRMKQRYFRGPLFCFLAALLVALVSIAPVAAQAPQPAPTQPAAPAPPETPPAKVALPSDIADGVARLTAAIEAAEKTIQHLTELEEELGRLRVDVESILSDSTQTAETLRPQLAAVRSQIEKLGPAPAKDAPAEAPAIAAERARLMALASELDGAVKAAELT